MKKKKILLLGATGMAGHIVYYYLYSTGRYDIVNVVFRNKLTDDSIVLDIIDKVAVENLIEKQQPDIIINCVGILIKGSQTYPENAIYINAYFPHFLKMLSDKYDSKLIHISTDCVFSGQKGNYSEVDFRDADDVYGRSKALGEIINKKDLTIRTSIIGPELKQTGEGLFHWFMNQTGNIKGYVNAIWSGVTTLELAKAIDFAIEKNSTGLVQLSNGISINKYDLLLLFQKIWEKYDVKILSFTNDNIDKSIIKSAKFDYNVPNYQDMLFDLHLWMIKYCYLYNSIYPI
jgi:dTDP-4-dehydrorhamnose reductase